MSTALTTYTRPTWPSLLGRSVFDDVFENFFTDFPKHHRKSVQGYPVADIYRDEEGSTVMEFALAGFSREELSICVQPDKRSITVDTYVLHNLVIAAYNARLPPLATGAGPVADALATGALLLPAVQAAREAARRSTPG